MIIVYKKAVSSIILIQKLRKQFLNSIFSQLLILILILLNHQSNHPQFCLSKELTANLFTCLRKYLKENCYIDFHEMEQALKCFMNYVQKEAQLYWLQKKRMVIFLEDLIHIRGYQKMPILKRLELFSSHSLMVEEGDLSSLKLRVKNKILLFEIQRRIGLLGLERKV